MGVYGIKLERMSLATLVIALGLLVDNGIVVAEDFKKRISDGVDRREAVTQTGRELALPLLASTATTVMVFYPLIASQDGSAEYTRNISIVILISLSVSWLIAMLVTPMLCYWFAQPDKEGDERSTVRKKVDSAFDWANTRYEKLLRWALVHRVIFVASMVAALVLSGMSLQFVQQKFFPASDRPQLLIYADMPVGTSSRATDRMIQDLSQFIADEDRYPDIESVASYAGFGGPRFVLSLAPSDPAPNRGFFVLNAKDVEARDAAVESLRRELAVAFPEARLRVTGMFLGPSDPNILQVQVRGPDDAVLLETGEKLADIFRSVDGTIDVFSDWENPSLQYAIELDQVSARAAGISSASVSSALSGFFSGVPAGVFRDGDDNVPIVIRATDSERTDPGALEGVTVARADGQAVPLSSVAQASLVPQQGRIHTEDLIRTLTIEGRPTAITPQDMVPTVQEQIDELEATLPAGHFIEWDGIIAESAEGNEAIFGALPIVIAAIIMLLVAQFGGFRRAAVIFVTMPLLLIGAAIGLHIMRADFGFMVILGLFALIGILINSAIVLVDRIDLERAAAGDEELERDVGNPPELSGQDEETTDANDQDSVLTKAIISASLRRFRPIIMTTITTVVGLLPLMIAQDVLFYGMASVIAFGLLVGTVLTLGVVPVLYAWFFGAEKENAAR
ncbi:efflux RND transporter permease subunit [Aurantiacibacter gangjinensis]|uniref:efflux RND transporter permease subunit n=1 Tax=Aurantiacibacter gangjinensis TaxID=502682 RepID=UPI00069C07C8|nr:efflux RND transporter permease subunit [Aurantiacibacter gangjinensis]APE26901.1 Acriflavin resistance protein [Aurantiacibacter gangjinensis]